MRYRPFFFATMIALVAVTLIFVSPDTLGYTFDGNNYIANDGRPQWLSGVPVTYQFNENTSDLKTNIENGSDPRGAVNAAFNEWSSESDIELVQGADTFVTDGGINDGINLITFEDTASNNATVGGFLAVTLFWWSNNELVDADVIYSSSVNFTTLGTVGQYPIQPLTTHELGHFQGMEHSASLSATMFPYLQENGSITEGEDLPNAISHDDRAGVNQLYPSSHFETEFGGITGLVTRGELLTYGAHVVAVHEETGIVYGANLTLGSNQGSNYGRYEIQGLPSGDYKVYAEPMDGPTSSSNWTGSYPGIGYWGGTFLTGFQTTYFGGNSSPSTVTVLKGVTATANIATVDTVATINPRWTAFSYNGINFSSSRSGALNFYPGDTRHIVVIGDGISSVPDSGITCSDPNVIIDTSSRVNGTTSGGEPYSIFQITIPSNAFAGARNLQFKNGSEIAVFTGILYVNGAERLMPPNENIWADFSHTGAELGTLDYPVASVAEALVMVKDGGTITFDSGTSSETMTLNREVRLVSGGGTVRIGF